MKTMIIRITLAVCLMAACLVLLTPSGVVSAQGPARILDPQSVVPTHAYSVLASKWWKWVGSVPGPVNPVTDTTGANCAKGQSGDVWFLAGTFGGKVERTCTVPMGKLLFFPIYNTAWVATEPTDTAKMARQAVRQIINNVNVANLSTTIDGVPVKHLKNYRIYQWPALKSLPIFQLTLPVDNVFGLAAGVYGPASTDGYYLLVAPLSPGTHTIQIKAMDYVDVKYNLTIQ